MERKVRIKSRKEAEKVKRKRRKETQYDWSDLLVKILAVIVVK